jgi:hypothetical protein
MSGIIFVFAAACLETCGNTGFGRKHYEFLDFSNISNNGTFRAGSVANVLSFRGDVSRYRACSYH